MAPKDNTDTQRLAKLEGKHNGLQNELSEHKRIKEVERQEDRESRTQIYNRLGKLEIDNQTQTVILNDIKKDK